MAGFWRRILKKTAERPEDFRAWFRFEYALERQMQTPVQEGLQAEDFFRACEEQLLPAEALYQRLLVGSNAAGDIGMLTAPASFTAEERGFWRPGTGRRR